MLPTLPSLIKLCEAFNISVSQFFLEDNKQAVLLNEKQVKLLDAASRLNASQYAALLNFLQVL